MSNDGPEWFAPKRYGYGAGLPVNWQGTLFYVAVLSWLLFLFNVVMPTYPGLAFLAFILSMPFLIWIAMIKTRGGWRWRWGDDA